MDKKKILDYQSIKKKIRRISLQILESNNDQDEIIIAGIDVNGFIIATVSYTHLTLPTILRV